MSSTDSVTPTTATTISTMGTASFSTTVLAAILSTVIIFLLLGLIVTLGIIICLAVNRKETKSDIDHSYEIPGGSAQLHLATPTCRSAMSIAPDVLTQNMAYCTSASVDATDSKVPEVMTQNSAYGTSASTDATDSKAPDIMTQNSAYGQSSTRNDVDQEYESIATYFSTLGENVMTQNRAYTSASADVRDSKVPDVMTQNSAYGQLSTANDGNREYENVTTDFRTLDDNVVSVSADVVSVSADAVIETQNNACHDAQSGDY